MKRIRNSLVLAAALLVTLPAPAQDDAEVTLNWNDADIRKVIEAVSEVTGRNFIIDPRVNGKVTLLSSQPMSKEAFYEAFLSILSVHGYVAVSSGDLIKIRPGRKRPAQFPGPMSTGEDDRSGRYAFITRTAVQVRNIGATPRSSCRFCAR